MGKIKVLLFDLGGVILDIDFNRVFAHWAANSTKTMSEIRNAFKVDSFYMAHEKGEVDASDNFESLRKSLGIELTDQQFEEGWNDIFVGELPGISALLQNTKERIPIYAFSNSNDTHQKVWSARFAETLSNFKAIYNSSEIGKRKPDADAYKTVAKLIGVDLHDILFFDDSIEKIKGAKNVEMQTVHVKSVADIEKGIKEIL